MSQVKQVVEKTLDQAPELLEKAEDQGYLTLDDLTDAFPDAERNTTLMANLMKALDQEGIEVVREKEQTEEPSTEDLEEVDDESLQSYDLSEINVSDSITLYLREMASVPLLTGEEEVILAKQLERGRHAESLLAQGGHSPETREQCLHDIEVAQNARAHLIKANTRLVVSIAKRYMGMGVPFLDLIQEGNLGLMKAVEKFDYRRGCKFSTYATWWIRQSVTRSLAQHGRVIRLPSHVKDRIRKVYRTAEYLEQHGNERPTAQEIAEEMGLKPDKVLWLLRVSRQPLSLEKPVGEEEDSELGEFIEDESSPTPNEVAAQDLLAETVEALLSTLTPREARILRLRFGLQGDRAYTLKEVGKKFGLTRERIRQIERDALDRLRHPSRARQLRGYLS